MKAIKSLSDLTLDDRNPNKGTEKGRAIVGESLTRLGAGRSVLADKNGKVIAGNKTVLQASSAGFEVEVVRTKGRRLVVVQREDLDLDDLDGDARKLAFADNRSAELGLLWDQDEIDVLFLTAADIDWLEFESAAKEFEENQEVGTFLKDKEPVQKSDTPRDKKEIECPKCGHTWAKWHDVRGERRDGDVKQARARINRDVELGNRPAADDLHCAMCGHKGPDKIHEYHHISGYGADHHYDVIPLCSTCHHAEHKK